MTAPHPILDSEHVLRRFEGELRRFFGARVQGPEADDLVQDTLLRVHQGVGALRAQDRLAPWVYRVARSVLIDHHRRAAAAARRQAALVEDPAAGPEEPDAEDALLRPLLAACLEPFLEGLPPEQAEALRLTDQGGLRQAEAARRLGVPLPTLKARVQRGRRRMRAAFEACCELVIDPRGAVIEARPRACGCGAPA